MKRAPWLGLALAAGLALAPAAHGAHGGGPSVAMTEPDYLKWLIDSRQPVVVVDLRAPDEFRRGHLPGAVSVPIEEAATAYAFLEAKGYLNHVVLQEGYDGWLRRRFPIAK